MALMLMLPLCTVGKKWSHSTSYGSWYIHTAICPDYDSWHSKTDWFSKTDTQDDAVHAMTTTNAVDALATPTTIDGGKSCMQLANDYFGTTSYLRGILFATQDNCTLFFDDEYVGFDVSNPSTGVLWAVTMPAGTGPWNVSGVGATWGLGGTCYGFERKVCANKDGAHTAASCGIGYTAKAGSTACLACSDNGNECCTEILRGNVLRRHFLQLILFGHCLFIVCIHLCVHSENMCQQRRRRHCSNLWHRSRTQSRVYHLSDMCQQWSRVLHMRFRRLGQ